MNSALQKIVRIKPRTFEGYCRHKAAQRRAEDVREIRVPLDEIISVLCGGFFLAAGWFAAWAVLG